MDNVYNYNEIGHKLRLARLNKNISQTYLAKKCNISASYLSHIESGTRVIPIDTFISICNELSLNPNFVLKDNIINNDAILYGILEQVKKLGPETYRKYINTIKALAEVADKL